MNNSKRKLGLIIMISGISMMVLSICLSLVSIYMESGDGRGSTPFPPFLGTLFLPLGIGVWLVGLIIARKNSPHSWEAIYKGHKIRVENEATGEKLFIDDELQDTKTGLKLRSQLQGKIKNGAGEDELVEAKLGGFWKVGCQLSVNKVPIQVTES